MGIGCGADDSRGQEGGMRNAWRIGFCLLLLLSAVLAGAVVWLRGELLQARREVEEYRRRDAEQWEFVRWLMEDEARRREEGKEDLKKLGFKEDK
jgi:hypothetical protein